MKKVIKIIKKVISVMLIILIVCILAVVGVVTFVYIDSKEKILTIEEAAKLEDIDCILVLGASVYGDKPSPILKERIVRGVELYNAGCSDKILMSGDHSGMYYDEVNTMKNYAINYGVPSSDIFMDHAGLSTYESIYRAKEIYQARKVIIVTQPYHLYRALYIAERLGLDAYGVAADGNNLKGQTKRNIREWFAICKDFVGVIIKPEPTVMGNTISLDGDGDITNDR